MKRDRDQLWAEAATREAGGESIRLTENLWPAAAAEQQQRVVENPFVSVLERVLRENNELADDELAVGELVVGELVDGELMEGMIAAEDVWTIVGVRPAQRTQDNNEKLGDAMKQLGWERTRLRVGAGKRSGKLIGDTAGEFDELRHIGLQHSAHVAEHPKERENCRADIAPTSALRVGV